MSRIWAVAAISLLSWTGAGAQPRSVEEEVALNIRSQAVGRFRVGHLALPDGFVDRLGDRIIRESFRTRFFGAVGLPVGGAPVGVEGAKEPRPFPFAVRTLADRVDSAARWAKLSLGAPELRGFRFSYQAVADWPQAGTGEQVEVLVIGERLARDGLLPTLATVLESLGASRFLSAGPPEVMELRKLGLPVDLLRYFDEHGRHLKVLRDLADRLSLGETATALAEELRDVPFHFRPSAQGFSVALEDGSEPLDLLRTQLPRGDHWSGVEDGDGLHIVRQLLENLPTSAMLVHIDERHLRPFADLFESWGISDPGRVTVLPQPHPVSQWAQDNGKAGSIRSGDDKPEAATLVPRYASRREDVSVFLPGDSIALADLSSHGHRVVESPLLFQGGDMLAVRHPDSGQRILFLGEAEIYRNVARGLTQVQVIAAFRDEFGVDRCIPLPSISFHLDFDVCFRATGEELIAFVNDPAAAARLILGLGVDALESAGLESSKADQARDFLQEDRRREFIDLVAGFVGSQRGVEGFPFTFVSHFGGEVPGVGVGGLTRFLTVLDFYIARTLTAQELARPGHATAVHRSFVRRGRSQERLETRLKELGCRVVRIPGFSEGAESLSGINGVHGKGVYLLPTYGGIYGPLDRVAARAFKSALGDGVRVVPILSGESQRRMGAVHCSVAPYPVRDPW